MKFEFDNNYPIHMQLVKYILFYISNGTLKPNEKLPSVRELAEIAGVNHNTIQKALNEVEDLGLIYTNRTNGKYVTENQDLIKKFKENMINEKIDQFLKEMKKIGIEKLKLEIKTTESEEVKTYEYSKD